MEIIKRALSAVQIEKDQVAGLVYDLDNESRKSWRYEIEWHRKFAMSLACLMFFFIGAPLGAIIRKGGVGTPIIIAIIFFVLYYVIGMIGEKSAREGEMTPYKGMWMSTFIVLPIGIFLTYKATRDSSIFNPEVYIRYLKKGLKFIFITQKDTRPLLEFKPSESDLNPQELLVNLSELSALSKQYITAHFERSAPFQNMWLRKPDDELAVIARKYDYVRVAILHSQIEMIAETAEEYPDAGLHNYKIEVIKPWQPLVATVIFPIGLFLYVKLSLQKNSLRNELLNIMACNNNLINELNSII